MYKVIPIKAFQDNYIWVLVEPSENYCVVVDPGDAEPVLAFLNDTKIKPCAIFITHHHPDHTNGVAKLIDYFHIPVYGSERSNLAFISDYVSQSDEVMIPEFKQSFNVLAVPGHTLDHIAFYDATCLFPGDCLFLGGCGRVFEGTAKQMVNSLSKFIHLNDDIMIYCAHEYTLQNLMFALSIEPNNLKLKQRVQKITKIRFAGDITIPEKLAMEKQTNPFLRLDDLVFRKHCETQLGQEFADNVTLFQTLRTLKDKFSFSEIDFLRAT